MSTHFKQASDAPGVIKFTIFLHLKVLYWDFHLMNQNIFTIFYSTSKKYGFENPTLKMIGSIRPMETIQTKSLLDLQ